MRLHLSIQKLNYLKIFDTSLWPHKEKTIRILAIFFLISFLFLRIPNLQIQFKTSIISVENYRNIIIWKRQECFYPDLKRKPFKSIEKGERHESITSMCIVLYIVNIHIDELSTR